MESSLLKTNNDNDHGTSLPKHKRLGRPPKNKPQQQQPQHDQYQHMQLNQSGVNFSNNTKIITPEMITSSLSECRRSSRKKIIKFDVRDLLKKNRYHNNNNKPHKVQIEARIDSVVTSSNNIYSQHINNSSTAAVDTTNDDMMYVEEPKNCIKQIAVNSSSNIKHFKVINKFSDESNSIIENEEQQNIISPKKRGRPPNIHNFTSSINVPDKMPKRGRGRPPKCRNQEKHVPFVENTKIFKPHLSSSVSVLVKKLDLTDGQVFKVTDNNCFEQINNIENKILIKKYEEKYAKYDEFNSQQQPDVMRAKIQQKTYNYAEEDTYLEEIEEEEEPGDLERQNEEEIIFEISSTSSLESSNLKRDDDVDFEIINESAEPVHNMIMNNSERRQRNFACVSFMQQQSDLRQNEENETITTTSPEFIVADVEEIISDNHNFIIQTEEEYEVEEDKEESNNINIEVYEEEEEDQNREQEQETTALDDSFIVIMDMKDDDESSSCALLSQQEQEDLDLLECHIENSPQNNSTTSNNDNIEFFMDQELQQNQEQHLQQDSKTIESNPININNELKLNSSRTKDEFYSSECVKEMQITKELVKISDTIFIDNKCKKFLEKKVSLSKEPKDEEDKKSTNKLCREYKEIEHSIDQIHLNSQKENSSAKIDSNGDSDMEICPDENNEAILSANNNNMNDKINIATKLINSMVIENETDSISIELIEDIMGEVQEDENLIAEKTENVEKKDKFDNNAITMAGQSPTVVQYQTKQNIENISNTSNAHINILQTVSDEQINEKIAKTCNDNILEDLSSGAIKNVNAKSEEISKPDVVDSEKLKATKFNHVQESGNQVVLNVFNNHNISYDDNDMTKKSNTKETLKHMNEISQDINVETSTLIDILRTVESNKQEITESDPSNDVESPATVQRRRSEKHFRYVVDSVRPKTLEETFAEIAEQSTKVVLEMAAVGNKKIEVAEQNSSIVENLVYTIEKKNCNEIEHKNKHNMIIINSSNDYNNVQMTNSPKRRGRKPKQKIQLQDKVSKSLFFVDEKVKTEEKIKGEIFQKSVDKKHDEIDMKQQSKEDGNKNEENKEKEEEIVNLLSKNMQISNNISRLDTNEKKQEQNNAKECCLLTVENPFENTKKTLESCKKILVVKEKKKSRWDEEEFRQDSATVRKQLEDELELKKKNRQNELEEAFKAALSEVANNNSFMDIHEVNDNLSQNAITAKTKTTTTINPNLKLDLTDATLPLMLYKSMTAKLDKEIIKNHNNSKNNKLLLDKNPLSDIEKFIADGVSLLKRTNAAADADAEYRTSTSTPENIDKKQFFFEKPQQQYVVQKQAQQSEISDEHNITVKNISFSKLVNDEILLSNIVNDFSKTSRRKMTIVDQKEEEEEVDGEENKVQNNKNDLNEVAEEEEEKPVLGKMVFESRNKTFTISSESFENINYGAALESHGGDENAASLRRSHRIKQITKAPKALVGRGLVRDKERFSLKDDVETKTAYSLDDHLTDLAEVEAKNAKFLKDMEERLSNFHVIKENEYKCEHLISKEARKMICDCFLTKEEEERGELGCGEDCLNRLLMIECGPSCNVKERCTNKRFQKFLSSPCRVFRTEKKGFGIMADIEILPGEFIMEYVGEVLDGDEFEFRRTSYALDKNRHYYFMALRSDAIIDATTKGNISRFINHSCDPNAETQKWTVNGELRIGFFSRKSIMPGEEITFDYQYQRYGREAQRCYCESSNCRGWIGEEPNSDEGEQQDDDESDDDLLGVDVDDVTDDDDDSVSDPLEVQKKLEIAAAAAKLMPMSEEERHKKKHNKIEDEDSTTKFRKLLNKISEKVAKKKQEQRKASRGRPRKLLKIMNNNDVLSPSKGRFVEDPDIEDEVDFLKANGLKNQSDTLSLSRLMVRAKLPQTRLNLLEVLRQGEEPCRRLFLDYHGLRLLHGWMNENSNNMDIRLALLKTLKRLPITNKTVLKESKVLQTMHNWCHQHKSQTKNTNNFKDNNSSPSDESSKESIAVGVSGIAEENVVAGATTVSDIESEVCKHAKKLISSWDNLLEIFRIPKRERLEQMKEHEREADRQYVATLDNDDNQIKQKLIEKNNNGDSQQHQRDRFGRGLITRVQNNRPYSNRHNNNPTTTVFRRRSGYDSGDIRHLSKEKRREIFAARVAREEAEKLMTSERREFEIKCRFFGLNIKRTKPHDIPFCVNTTTGQWYAFDRRPITTPPNYRHAPMRPKYKSTNPNDYRLPSFVSQLPKNWRYAITPLGKIYYYHVKYRQPQWEQPGANKISGELLSKIESGTDVDIETTDDDEHILKDMDEVQVKMYKEQKVDVRRNKRRNNLITERPISPRRDEDRAYNQQEVRKYKENKEKVRKRKEEIRRRRVEELKRTLSKTTSTTTIVTPTPTLTYEDNITESTLYVNKNEETYNENENAACKTNEQQQPDALPIQEYLLSSDEDHAAENIENDDGGNDYGDDGDNTNSNAMLYKIDEGDKIVDEFDALMTKNILLKRPLPSLNDYSLAVQLKQQQHSSSNRPNSSENIDLPSGSHNSEKYELHKRRKQGKKDKEKSKRNNNSSTNNNNNGGVRSKDNDAKLRKIREKFRCDIAGIIMHYLKRYL